MRRMVNGSIVWGHHDRCPATPPVCLNLTRLISETGQVMAQTSQNTPAGWDASQQTACTTTAHRAASLATHFDLHQYLGKDAKGFGEEFKA